MNNKKIIVISAVNLVEGGTLAILNECLSSLNLYLTTNKNYDVIALVHDKHLCFYSNIKYVNLKKIKESWLNRLLFEYYISNKISKRIKPYIWISLHDISPIVKAEKQVVYCHNSTPFYKTRFKDLYFNYKFFLFSIFYKYLYRINIKSNDYVIVQQNWMRDKFSKLYKLSKEKIIVSYPEKQVLLDQIISSLNDEKEIKKSEILFFYPSFPRPFKNFELICEAVKYLNENGYNQFKVILTIDGSENNYSKWIIETYGFLKNISFVGLLSSQKVKDYYRQSDCLIFPSKLETWGLPISEFIPYNKPMILSDLPYAHETSSLAQKVSFFNPEKVLELARLMKDILNQDYSRFEVSNLDKIHDPYTNSWKELFQIILK